MSNQSSEIYSQYCKPNLSSQLKALALDINYYKGSGNYLWYKKDKGDIKVLDLLGGYGSLMFGHNNDTLVKVMLKSLHQQVPFATQGSTRGEAGELAKILNKILNEKLGEDYLSIFSNSGAEAIEVCIKHCFYTASNNFKEQLDKIKLSMKTLEQKIDYPLDFDEDLMATIKYSSCDPHFSTNLSEAIKILNLLNEKAAKQPPVLIAITKAFHGKTLGAIQLTHNIHYKQEMPELMAKTIHIRDNQLNELEDAIRNHSEMLYSISVENRKLKLKTKNFSRVAAFIVEPIQGEGGMNTINSEFLLSASRICKSYNIPIVFDEIQTGMGRTGTFLFAEQTGVVPDYITLSKSLGGGITKIGATLIPRRIFGANFDKIHSSTFAEDSLSALVATKAIELLDDGMLKNIHDRNLQVRFGTNQIAKKYPGILAPLKGVGLMLGLEFINPCCSGSRCLRLLADQDMLGYIISGYLLHEWNIRTLPCLSATHVIRIEPSGNTSESEISYFLLALQRVCEILYKENMYELCKFMVGKQKVGANTKIKNYRKPVFIEEEKESCDKKVAFIGHFIHARDMSDWDDSFESFTELELEKILETIYSIVSPFVSDRKIVIGENGERVQLDMMGFIISSAIISKHMRANNLQPLNDKIIETIRLSVSNGCTMVGFGGFSSIITGNCKHLPEMNTGYTTGNAFTTAMGIKAMLSETPAMGISIPQATFAAVGAGGNIASVYSEFMAQRVQRIILNGAKGRTSNIITLAKKIFCDTLQDLVENNGVADKGIARKLFQSIAVQNFLAAPCDVIDFDELYHLAEAELGEDFPIVVTDEISRIADANLILCSTNLEIPIIFPDMIGKHPTVICDIALPSDVDDSVKCLSHVKVIQGGVVRIPNDQNFKIGGIKLQKGNAYACMSETLLLGLAGIKEHFSYGHITLKQVKQIYKISNQFGFRLAEAKMERSF